MNQAIEMICWHDENGNIRPYRFKMRDDEGESATINVSKIIWKKEEKIVGVNYLIFNLMCLVNEHMIRNFEVRFNTQNLRWYITKII